MAQSGLHISADQGSELAVFDNVYADIGDEQSIEQSLSTFSGHMSNIVKILSKADEFSLVLLDELGAGTDPVEGAALAVAILQYLYDKHISTFVTTHYSELKLYAISTPGVENAACEFDINNLKPTYRLLIGAPGKSNAFAISSKLGLDTSIIEKAKQMLKTDDIRFEDIITDLHLRQGKQADEEQKIERDRKEIAALRKELKIERDKLLSRKEKILLDAKIRSEEIIRKSKEEVDELVREILRKKRNNETIKSMDETRDKLRAKLKDAQASLKTSNKILISKDFKEGDTVLVNSFNQLATIISLSKNEATVQMGSIRLNIALSDLSWTDKMHKTKPDANINVRVKRKNVSNILDLRGKLVSESLDELDKYLSEACLSNLAQISIIHGKGTGALRSAIHAYLKKQTVVLEYRLGSYGEGDTGITMVKLR
jgi:DNA mismatch repair protein MutS2